MKKLLVVLLALLMVFGLTACGKDNGGETGEKETLYIFAPGEYLSDEVIANFEKENNCRVYYEKFDSNESMYTKLMSGTAYDLLVPSDYMIERLIKEKMLQPLDLSVVTSWDELSEGVKKLAFDPEGKYAAPYFWGTVGIVYDTTVVDEEEVERLGWNIFLESKYAGNAYMYDSERDAFMIALKALGYSMNTENTDEIEAAYQWLLTMTKNLEPSFVTDECIDGMVEGEMALALMYSGDAAYVLDENEDMGYCEPFQGTNLFVDAMVIPTNSKNPALANKFINYMMGYEAQLINSDEFGYTTVNQKAFEELYGEDGTYEGNVAFNPRANGENDETFGDIEVLREAIAEKWVKVKAAN